MRLWLVSFTARGSRLARNIAALWGGECRRFAPARHCLDRGCTPLKNGLRPWVADAFRQAEGIVFVGAVGIAVRAIAPFVHDKRTDPAVVVIDENAKFSISLLSGHLGGANRLAQRMAEMTGSVPVITTATDGKNLFAVDVFAAENNLYLKDMRLAKEVSAALLAGEKVGFVSELPVLGPVPPELADEAELGIAVTARLDWTPFPRTLHLVPRRITVGIGCRRGKSAEAIAAYIGEILCECGLDLSQLAQVASIDRKKDEAGIVSFCRRHRLPFRTYSTEQLNALSGVFSGSDFVKSETGVDCVCERAALLACGGTLLFKKRARDGITIALAESGEGVSFV